jgi:GGDEF domain-containing protein
MEALGVNALERLRPEEGNNAFAEACNSWVKLELGESITNEKIINQLANEWVGTNIQNLQNRFPGDSKYILDEKQKERIFKLVVRKCKSHLKGSQNLKTDRLDGINDFFNVHLGGYLNYFLLAAKINEGTLLSPLLERDIQKALVKPFNPNSVEAVANVQAVSKEVQSEALEGQKPRRIFNNSAFKTDLVEDIQALAENTIDSNGKESQKRPVEYIALDIRMLTEVNNNAIKDQISGDEMVRDLLVVIANVLPETAQTDYRTGGDEFVIRYEPKDGDPTREVLIETIKNEIAKYKLSKYINPTRFVENYRAKLEYDLEAFDSYLLRQARNDIISSQGYATFTQALTLGLDNTVKRYLEQKPIQIAVGGMSTVQILESLYSDDHTNDLINIGAENDIDKIGGNLASTLYQKMYSDKKKAKESDLTLASQSLDVMINSMLTIQIAETRSVKERRMAAPTYKGKERRKQERRGNAGVFHDSLNQIKYALTKEVEGGDQIFDQMIRAIEAYNGVRNKSSAK